MALGVGCLGAIFFAIILFSVASSGEISSGLIWFCIIGVAGSCFGGLWADSKRKINVANEQKQKIKEILLGLENFNISQEFYSPNMESLIAIDEQTKQFCIIENKHENYMELSTTFSKYEYDHKVFNYNEILQSEILEDGATITTTSRRSQLGGALLGGVLAGGVGAVIGGLSGSQSSSQEVKKIQLQVVVNDTKKSFYRITFMSLENGVKKDMSVYKLANKNVTHWHNLISYLINHADKKDGVVNQSTTTNLDEIRKLSELFKEGILTEEEFNQQKQKLLS
jgi:hypothetical protein